MNTILRATKKRSAKYHGRRIGASVWKTPDMITSSGDQNPGLLFSKSSPDNQNKNTAGRACMRVGFKGTSQLGIESKVKLASYCMRKPTRLPQASYSTRYLTNIFWISLPGLFINLSRAHSGGSETFTDVQRPRPTYTEYGLLVPGTRSETKTPGLFS